MRRRTKRLAIAAVAAMLAVASLTLISGQDNSGFGNRPPQAGNRPLKGFDATIQQHGERLIREGREIFRFDTFGSEEFWGGKLRLHEAIAGSRHGGVGPGLSARSAVRRGLKIDAEALPPSLVADIRANRVNLADPAVTLALLKLNAVIGLTGFFSPEGRLQSIGIQCALCHSTVDHSFGTSEIPAGVVGARLDGWPNRDLDVGSITALSPSLQPFAELLGLDEATVRKVLLSWGPGKYDAELNLDGKAFRPDGKSGATLLPAAFGLAGISQHTYTGWGGISHWNAYVANLQMHGKGTLWDPRLKDADRFPIAARAGFDNVRSDPDLITSKLAALHVYQLSIPPPTEAPNSADAAQNEAIARGEALFNGKAQCGTCHVPPLYTEPGWNMHTPGEIGIDDFQANRSPDGRYRTTPLRGMVAKRKGGFYHDGRFATLMDVVNHYDQHFGLSLTDEEKRDLAVFVGSL